MLAIRNWSDLTMDEKYPWVEKARDIVFPDLRGCADDHDAKIMQKSLEVVAKGLFKAHVLQRQVKMTNVTVEAIIDNPASTKWTVKKG